MTKERIVDAAYSWLNMQIKANKMRNKRLAISEDVNIYMVSGNSDKEIFIGNLIALTNILGISYYREDWDGNAHCETNHDIVYFYYRNYKFFELVSKEIKNEGE